MILSIIRASGIYKITNLITQKFYIGSSIDLCRRKIEHFSALRTNKHHSILLQRAFNKYGEENFIFEVVECCEKENLIKREQHYLDTLKPQYNISSLAINSSDLQRKAIIQFTIEGNKIKEYISLAEARRTTKILGIESVCSRFCNQAGGFRWMYKEDYIKNNYTLYPLKPNANIGRKKNHNKEVVQLNRVTNKLIAEYRSILEASKQTKAFELSISKACRGLIKSSLGYKWIYKKDYDSLHVAV
jgi:group I intron endonuclease